MAVPIPYVHLGIGVVTILASLPLVARWVPMNRIYGIRTAGAFVSEANWLEVNAYGGKLLLGFGAFLVAFALLAGRFSPPPRSPLAPLFLIAPLLALWPVLRLIAAFSRRLPGR